MSNEYPPPGTGPEPVDPPAQAPAPPPPSMPPAPPYGQPPYGAPGGFGQPQQTSPLAIVSLVLGILGVPCCTFFLFGIAAVVTGLLARQQIDASQGRLKGNGMAMAGVILGALAIVISLVYWILALTGVINTSFNLDA
jgi:hypothetical protein